MQVHTCEPSVFWQLACSSHSEPKEHSSTSVIWSQTNIRHSKCKWQIKSCLSFIYHAHSACLCSCVSVKWYSRFQMHPYKVVFDKPDIDLLSIQGLSLVLSLICCVSLTQTGRWVANPFTIIGTLHLTLPEQVETWFALIKHWAPSIEILSMILPMFQVRWRITFHTYR